MARHQSFASSSASIPVAASPRIGFYDVFISHCRSDVKRTFASHLYRRLLMWGLKVFLNPQELHLGEDLTPHIEKTIAMASVHVAIFFPGYAESKRFLDELLLMIKSGASILPVYYNVKPFELQRYRSERGAYAEALSLVAGISGLELEAYYGDEGELLDRVVNALLKRLPRPALHVAKYPTGLDEKVQDFERTVLLQQHHHIGEVKVVGIVGLGGSGKTTLAKELFNRKRSDYVGSSFLFDVRETQATGSLIFMQKRLIKDLAGLDIAIDSIDQGIEILAHKLSDLRALIILDDVDDVHQLYALLPARHVLNPLSLIVITSRDKQVLLGSGIPDSSIYKLTGLDTEHSRELFCLHAFHQPYPIVGFNELVDNFLIACNGLPLSLEVIGAHLCGKDVEYWKAQLDRLSTELPNDVPMRLKISYDALDDEEKEIFLDIACFFIGEDSEKAITIWDGSGWAGSLALRNLVNRCLVEVDDNNCIRMHDHFRDLGRDLAENEPLNLNRRLWRPIDNSVLHDVFQHQTSVRGINVVQSSSGQALEGPLDLGNRFTNFTLTNRLVDMGNRLMDFIFSSHFVGVGNPSNNFRLDERFLDMSGFQLLRAKGDCLESISNLLKHSDLLWLCWDIYPYPSLPSWIPKKNLRVLEVARGRLETLWENTESEVPLQLRELNIGASLLRVPKSIGLLKYLEKIEMKDTIEPLPEECFHLPSLKHLRLVTRMVHLPHSFENLTNLQHLDLSGCTNLQTLPPSLGNLASLKHINLSGCFKLEILPNSFGNLSRLHHLSLAGCGNLTISSTTFGNIRALESLDLSTCLRMGALPPEVTQQHSLERINLSHTNLRELPDSIGNLSNLETLKLQCPELEMLPSSLGKLTSLKELTLHFCDKLRRLPDSVGQLVHLTMLTIHYAPIEYLPVDVMRLNNLEILKVRGCRLLEVPFGSVEKVGMLGICMIRLKHLDLQGTRLKKLAFCEGVCPNLQRLNVSFCHELVGVGALPTTVVSLELQECPALEEIKGLSGIAELRLLDISGCRKIEELPGLEELDSLEELRADGCNKLACIGKIRMNIKRKSCNFSHFLDGKKRKA